jgi:hypothetical protein
VDDALTTEDKFGGSGERERLGIRIGRMLGITPEELSLLALSKRSVID